MALRSLVKIKRIMNELRCLITSVFCTSRGCKTPIPHHNMWDTLICIQGFKLVPVVPSVMNFWVGLWWVMIIQEDTIGNGLGFDTL